MKQKKIKLSVLLLSIGISVQAQQATTTTGGDASGSGGTVAYSVGQVVYTTNTDASGTVSQGVQQAYEIFTVGIKETELNISLSVYPNPTADNLTLQIQDYNNEKLSYQLFDMQGKQLSNGQIVAQQTQINMNSLPTATYFVNVVNQENKKVQSFKIIKN
ncbi:MAG: T9SS type A sorting domain-containing protein [Bacteroidetes bacterium]|nr:T9SS type A sorting domain-containing protein [Bacteroidota bacterium]